MDDALAWSQLVATVGLLVVTYWYARTTKKMADSASRAAEDSALATSAAERSAEAARDAATVAQSQIKPQFTGRQIALAPRKGEEQIACLRIDSTGDAVVIQKVRIRRAFRKSYDLDDNPQVAIRDVEMTAAGTDSYLPKRLHYGEHLLLTHPSIQDARDDPFTRFIVDIEYTFSEAGGAGATKELVVDTK